MDGVLIWGWDADNEEWVPIQVNEDGELVDTMTGASEWQFHCRCGKEFHVMIARRGDPEQNCRDAVAAAVVAGWHEGWPCHAPPKFGENMILRCSQQCEDEARRQRDKSLPGEYRWWLREIASMDPDDLEGCQARIGELEETHRPVATRSIKWLSEHPDRNHD